MKLAPQESLDVIAPPTGTQRWPNESDLPRRAFVTSDGVQLSYIRQGSGRPIVLLHGWSQCAEEFKHQIGPLSAQYDVIAVDQRSHGDSQKVSYGLKISRLAKDLPVRVPSREQQVIAKAQELAKGGPLPAEAVGRIYQKLVEEMRNWEATLDGADLVSACAELLIA